MSATPSSRLLELGQGRRIEVLSAGSGPAVLFLHGAGGIPQWDGVLPLLASRFTVHAPLRATDSPTASTRSRTTSTSSSTATTCSRPTDCP